MMASNGKEIIHILPKNKKHYVDLGYEIIEDGNDPETTRIQIGSQRATAIIGQDCGDTDGK